MMLLKKAKSHVVGVDNPIMIAKRGVISYETWSIFISISICLSTYSACLLIFKKEKENVIHLFFLSFAY